MLNLEINLWIISDLTILNIKCLSTYLSYLFISVISCSFQQSNPEIPLWNVFLSLSFWFYCKFIVIFCKITQFILMLSDTAVVHPTCDCIINPTTKGHYFCFTLSITFHKSKKRQSIASLLCLLNACHSQCYFSFGSSQLSLMYHFLQT
jgi:hypothetical protein